ncbi:MAG: phospho-N-acetylmuramoyl-pentapeptide-transferase, partial [Planctomycetota bacterium]|nr:phospho-N-acetylmuramoyl-pentapeptide-transferase [Planctomycetota bacterium]
AYLSGMAEWLGPLRVFESITFRTALGLALSFFIAIFMGRRFIALMRRLQAVEDVSKPDSATLHSLHAGKRGTPTMGGVVIIAAVVIAMALVGNLTNLLSLLAVGVLIAFGLLGLIDDYCKMRGWGKRGLTTGQKLAGQFLLAGATALVLYALVEHGLYAVVGVENGKPEARFVTKILLPFTKWKEIQPDLGWFYYFLFAFVLVACSNAVNLTDGLDGLAAGSTLMVVVTFGVFAYVVGHSKIADYLQIPYVPQSGELTVFCAVLAGAIMGFLWFNIHPAEIFMGDCGSLALGAAIAYVALIVRHEIVLLLAGGIFVAEALSVMAQVASFQWTGRRLLKCAPFHHHLEFCGWHENKVVVRLWMVGGVLAALALATLKMH